MAAPGSEQQGSDEQGSDEPISDGPATPGGRRIVVLTAQGTLSRIVVNGLVAHLGPIAVKSEQPESRGEIFRRRARLLGVVPAIGQIALATAMRFDRRRGRKLKEIYASHGLNPDPDPAVRVYPVPSMNAQACRDLLAELKPDVVAVYGTRILSPQTLAAVPAPFINYHAGITPKYRGQDPGYWALASGDAEHAGITIHLVDQGVDTGAVLYQQRVAFGVGDNIGTYQHVQAATALPLFARAIEDALANRLAPVVVDLPSMKWFPPTLWTYVRIGLTRGVW